MTTKKNNVTPTTPATTRKPADKQAFPIGDSNLEQVANFLGVDLNELEYKRITKSDSSIAFYCYIKLQSRIDVARKIIKSCEHKISSEKSTEAERAVASEKLQVAQIDLATLQMQLEKLNTQNMDCAPEIAVYLCDESQVWIGQEKNKAILETMDDLSKIASKHVATIGELLTAEIEKSQGKKAEKIENVDLTFLVYVKNLMQNAIVTCGFAQEYHVNNNDVIAMLSSLVYVDIRKDKKGNISKNSGLKPQRKETLAKVFFKLVSMKLVKREVALKAKAEREKVEKKEKK